MPKYVTNLSDLQTELMKLIGDTMLDIAIDAESQVKNTLQHEVYDAYTPTHYHRTYELMNSVDANVDQKGNSVSARIFHNPNLMKAVAPYGGNGFIGQHYSTYPYAVEDYRNYIAQTVNNGIGSGKKKVFGDGVYARPRPYFDHAEEFVNQNFGANMARGLKARGLKVI